MKAWLALLLFAALASADSTVPVAAPTADAKSPAVVGPFPSLLAACGELRERENRCLSDEPGGTDEDPRSDAEACTFRCRARTYRKIAQELPPPLDELVLFASDSFNPTAGPRNHSNQSANHEVSLNLGVRIGASWYVLSPLNRGPSWGLDDLKLLETRIAPTAVLLRFRSNQATTIAWEDDEQALALVGAGPSGRPSLIGPIAVRLATGTFPYGDEAEEGTQEKIVTRGWRLEPSALVVFDRTIEETKGSRPKRTRRAPPHEVVYQIAFP